MELGERGKLDGVQSWAELMDRLSEISEKRSRILAQLRQALVEGNVEKVFASASLLCSLDPAEVKGRRRSGESSSKYPG